LATARRERRSSKPKQTTRRLELVQPFLTFNRKEYSGAINKGVTAMEEAVREAAWRKEGYDAKTGKKVGAE